MVPSSLSSLSPSASISGNTAQTPPRYSMAPFHNVVEVSSPERSSMNMQMVGSSQPHEAVSVSGPIPSMSPTFLPAQSAQSLPASPQAYPVSPSSHKPRRRGLWITLTALLVLLVIGGS